MISDPLPPPTHSLAQGGAASPAAALLKQVKRLRQQYLDRSVVYTKARWGSFVGILLIFLYRVIHFHGYYIICYGLGIYLLNLFLSFLSPALDPDEDDGDGSLLPTTANADGEFRPFVRKLPEFTFWRNAFQATVASLLMTFFSVFDIAVYWPILFGYFCVLVIITLKDRVQHMLKHNYMPFNFGKKTYGDMTKVVAGAGRAKK